MSKYRCEECGHGCYFDTLEPGLPSKCIFDNHRKPCCILLHEVEIDAE